MVAEISEALEALDVQETPEARGWNDLPNELKIKCIEDMSFMTRTCLRLTSKHNNAVVESIRQKYPLDFLMINAQLFHYPACSVIAKSETFGTEFQFLRKSTSPFTNGVKETLEKCTIGYLDLKTPFKDGGEKAQDWISPDRKFHVGSVRLELRKDQSYEFEILRNVEHLQEVFVKDVANQYGESLDNFLLIPQVMKAKSVTFGKSVLWTVQARDYFLWTVLRHLVKNDHDLGKEVWFEDTRELYNDYLLLFPEAEVICYEEKSRALVLPTRFPGKFLLCRASARTNGLHLMITDGGMVEDDFERRMALRRRAKREMLARHKELDAANPRPKKLIYYGLTRQLRMMVEERIKSDQ